MIRCFLNPVLSRSYPIQASGAVFLSKRLFGDFSGRESIDQLPDLDKKTAERLNEKMSENCQISCLTQEDKKKLRANVISHLMREHIQEPTPTFRDIIHEVQYFSEMIKHSELANDPVILHNLHEISKRLEETSAKMEKTCQ